MEGQDRVLATAQQIVKSLHTSTNVNTDDMLLIFSSFDNRLSNLSNFMASSSSTSTPSSAKASAAAAAAATGDDYSFIDHRFQEAEKLILDGADGDPSSTQVYLAAVDEIIRLTEDLDLPPDNDVATRADGALQLAMAHLEDEFRHILIRSTVPLDAERLHNSSFLRRSSVSSSASEIPDFETGTFPEGQEDGSSGRYNHLRGPSLGGIELSLDLINPDATIELKEIADRMIRSGYEKECCQMYSTVRRDVLDECMSILGVERLSIEEVHRIEWRSLDEKMKKWIYAVKIVVRVLLSAEKQLCELIFNGSELTKEICFIETAKGCVMQLLNFGEAVFIAKRSSEKLFRILDMYDALSAVLPDLELLFCHEAGDMVCSEAKGVLDGLGEAAIGTFVEFEHAVRGEASRTPIQGADIHPLTRYVMNYVKLLVDYSNTINELLPNVESELESQADDSNDSELESKSLFAGRLSLLLKSLEANLEDKSRMYEDSGMQYIFLMNNLLYIVQKVKDSDLRQHLGDLWVRKRRGQVRQFATGYLRASWSKVLSCLKDEGIGGSSNSASKVALKERFKNFNTCFEELYRIQTAWKVPDAQLREELRISISEKVIPAYRSFMGRFGSQLESGRHSGKYIKYTPEDLENYLLDLFEGTPLSLHHMRRKSS